MISFAEARGWRPEGTPNPARWRGFLDLILAKPRTIRPVRHMRAVPYAEVPAVMAALAADPSVAAQALRFIVLTARKAGRGDQGNLGRDRLRGGRVDDPGVENEEPARASGAALPAGRSSCFDPSTAKRAIRILFISTRTPGGAVAESTLGIALRNAGCAATIHGFRSCLQDLGRGANELSRPRHRAEPRPPGRQRGRE